MARALKFFAAFFVTALIIFGSILMLNWKPFNTFFENRDAMIEGSRWVEETYSLRGLSYYIQENPGRVSVVSSVLSSPDSTIRYGADIPRPMGTIANLFTLIAAADAIENGRIDPDERLVWDRISRYQIPGLDPSEHRSSYRAAQSRGWIEQDGTITVNHALHLLAEFNDLALADYLWWMIEQEEWSQLSGRLDLEATDLPLPFSGLYLTISPGIRQKPAQQIYDQELSRERSVLRRDIIERSRRFTEDEEFRQRVISFAKENRLGTTFMDERDGLALFPKTTASEISGILEQLLNGELINEAVSRRVKEWMRWPMDRQSGIERDFTDYGAMYDNRMGLLNGIDFGTSAYTGDTTVQAVFFDRIQIAFWFHMSSNHMHQDFQQRLIFDPAMIKQMRDVAANATKEMSAIQPNQMETSRP